jgi:hypothetical protein
MSIRDHIESFATKLAAVRKSSHLSRDKRKGAERAIRDLCETLEV